MLVLTRKPGQAIVIDGRIIVHVVEVSRGRVQLGVLAPRDTPVYRDEIFRRIRAEQAELEHAELELALPSAVAG